MIALGAYLGLLLAGLVCFALYYLAQLQIARQLREHHPQQWKIIAEPDTAGPNRGRPGFLRSWLRLQQVLRASRPRLPELLGDAAITRWFRVWRATPWLAWLCWFAALALQWNAR